MKRESDLKLANEVFAPASLDHYTAWMEGYLESGGQVTAFESETEALQWEAEALFATEDFYLEGENGAEAKNIIVSDEADYEGEVGANRLYLLKDYSYIGIGDPTLFAIKSLRDLAPLYTENFKKAMIFSLAVDLNSKQNETNSKTTLDYLEMAEMLGIKITRDDFDDFEKRLIAEFEEFDSLLSPYFWSRLEQAKYAGKRAVSR
jgi:hypothetical protein